jgi:uncharacterized protein
MSKPAVEVQVRAVVPTSGGCAVFLGNGEKVFVIQVDQSAGAAIAMFLCGTQKQRPLTHDLFASILRAFEAKIERVIINDLKRGTYFARLVLGAQNELKQREMIEIDARPSDCIAMATQQTAAIRSSSSCAPRARTGESPGEHRGRGQTLRHRLFNVSRLRRPYTH